MSDKIPQWLDEIVVAINLTEGVDNVEWAPQDDGEFIVRFSFYTQAFEFTATTNGKNHGVECDGWVYDMTVTGDVSYWIACELVRRLDALALEQVINGSGRFRAHIDSNS